MLYKIVIRADASSLIGSGHLMRMLALSQLLIDSGCEVHFATIPYHPPILNCLAEESLHIHYLSKQDDWNLDKDLESLTALAADLGVKWVVLDGYQFTAGYERGIKQAGFSLLRVDDQPSDLYLADILLNQNFGAESMTHAISPNTRLLSGLKYLLLRREFRSVELYSKPFLEHGPFHLLVSLGGGSKVTDHLNYLILRWLLSSRHWHGTVTLIAGGMAKNHEQLAKLSKPALGQVEVIVQTNNMAVEMYKADLAIVSAGSTMWELLYMKVPFMAVSLNKAQCDYLEFVAREGLCENLGWHEDLTDEKLNTSLLSLVRDPHRRSQILKKANLLLDRDNNGNELLALLR